MPSLELLANLATSWKLGHQVATLNKCNTFFQNLIFSWHQNIIGSNVGQHLEMLEIWPQGCVNCIVTLPCIALLALPVSIELVSSSVRVNSVKFHKPSLEKVRPIDRTPGIPGTDKKLAKLFGIRRWSVRRPLESLFEHALVANMLRVICFASKQQLQP